MIEHTTLPQYNNNKEWVKEKNPLKIRGDQGFFFFALFNFSPLSATYFTKL